MHNRSRQEWNDRQKTDPENNFLDQKVICHNTVRPLSQTLCKVEPWKHSSYQPQNKRKIINRLRFETYLKNKPKDDNRNRRLNKCPSDT